MGISATFVIIEPAASGPTAPVSSGGVEAGRAVVVPSIGRRGAMQQTADGGKNVHRTAVLLKDPNPRSFASICILQGVVGRPEGRRVETRLVALCAVAI